MTWHLGVLAGAGIFIVLGVTAVVMAVQGRPVALVFAVAVAASQYRSYRRWMRTPRAITVLPAYKRQQRAAGWVLGLAAAIGIAVLLVAMGTTAIGIR